MMKLSQMTNDHALNVLPVMAVELTPIFRDDMLVSIISGLDFDYSENEDREEYGIRIIEKVSSLVPLIAAKYRDNLYRMLAAFLQIDVGEMRNRGFFSTLTDVKTMFQDEEALTFFSSFIGRGR